MAQDLRGNSAGTPEELHDTGTDAGAHAEVGRKGGAVAAAPYDREGQFAARGYDYTAATSERSGLGWLLPLMVALAVTAFIIWGVMRVASNERSSVGTEAPVAGSAQPATGVSGGTRFH